MITLVKWLLLKRRLSLPADTRWYDKGSMLIGTYKDQPPVGWQERLDLWLSNILTGG